MLGMQEIMAALPHRFPFLMVDRIVDIVPNERVTGYKNVTGSEPWVQGHFPGEPIFPGVLAIEMMAQIGAFMFWGQEREENQLRGLLSGVDRVKFLRKILPGDTVMVDATFVVRIGHLTQVKCEARVNGETVATALVTYAIPMQPRVRSGRNRSAHGGETP